MKTRKILNILILVSLGLLLTNFSFSSIAHLNGTQITSTVPIQSPKSTMGNLTIPSVSSQNVLLQESNNNQTVTGFSTDPGNQTLIESAPSSDIFNMSYANISVSNIQADNFSLNYDLSGSPSLSTVGNASGYNNPVFGMFSIPLSANITGFSFYGDLLSSETYDVYVYNATFNATLGNYAPGSWYVNPYAVFSNSLPVQVSNTIADFSIQTNPIFLNNSQTLNNKWFISIYTPTVGGKIFRWGYSSLFNNSLTVKDITASQTYETLPYDLAFNLTFSYPFASVNPNAINLTLNNTSVNSGVGNSGNYFIQNYTVNTPSLIYNFNTTWPNATWNVNQAIINYTAIISATTNFTIAASQLSYWNVTTNILNFNSSFTAYSINFTIPLQWTFNQLYFDDIVQDPGNILIMGQDSNQSIMIYPSIANNGTWVLISTSKNLMNNLETQVGSIDTSWAKWNDIVNITGICSEPISQNVNLSIYDSNLNQVFSVDPSFSNSFELGLANWSISSNITSYGNITLRVYWYNSTDAFLFEKNFTIVAATSFTEIGYAPYSQILSNYGPFNVSWIWSDLQNPETNYSGPGYTALYNLSGPTSYLNIPATSNSSGVFNATLDSTQLTPGNYQMDVSMSGILTDNASYSFYFEIVGSTTVTPDVLHTQTTVIRGVNATYSFNYTNTLANPAIIDGQIQNVTTDSSLVWSYQNNGNGNYQININTSAMDVIGTPYSCVFNISSTGNQTQPINFNLNIQISPSSLTILSWNNTLYRKDQQNLTVTVQFMDNTTYTPILNATLSNFAVLTLNDTPWNVTGVSPLGNGVYQIFVSTIGIDSGNYTLKIQGVFLPNHQNVTSAPFPFLLLGNTTEISMVYLKDSALNTLIQNSTDGSYNVYINDTLNVLCDFRDLDTGGVDIKNDPTTQISILVDNTYQSIFTPNPSLMIELSYGFSINLANIPIGIHNLTIIFSQNNFQNGTLNLSLNIMVKMKVAISLVSISSQIIVGSSFSVELKVTYFNSTSNTWLPLANSFVTVGSIPANAFTGTTSGTTNANGIVTFSLTISPSFPANSQFQLYANYTSSYNLAQASFVSPQETVTQSAINYIIYGVVGILILAVIIPIINSKVIKPRKQRYMDMVMSSATIFDDAINLKHILIIYKSAGTCIFFKSFGEETINPDLISGFISAVQSFGKEIRSQKSLNEMSYGDNVLLFSDGQYVRATLVLGKPASLYMKKNLAQFIGRFESEYQKKLQDWHGSLNAFRDSGTLIDEILKTSVILPHQLTQDKSLLKKASNSLAKQLISMAQGLITKERSFIFLAQLMSTAVTQMKKDPAELIVALNELLAWKILTPIQIESIAEKPKLSEEEIQKTKERVDALPGKSESEKADILKSLTDMNPVEREAALSSLAHSVKVTTSFSGQTIETKKFANQKEAKAELNRLEKQAKKSLKENNPEESIRTYEIAEVIGYQWNMDAEGKRFGEFVLSTTVNRYQNAIKKAKKMGSDLQKSKKYSDAIKEYEKGLDASDQLFKLGFLAIEEESKEFGRKIKECEKLGGSVQQTKEYITQENLLNARKTIQKQLKDPKVKTDFLFQNELNTKLLVIANLLFQNGIAEESNNIKKCKTSIETSKKQLKDTPENKKAEYDTQIQELNGKKQQLLDFAKEMETKEDWVNALAAYQQIMTIYYRTADCDNAIELLTKFKTVLQHIPDLEKVIQNFENESKKLKEANDTENSEIQAQYAKTIKEAIFKM